MDQPGRDQLRKAALAARQRNRLLRKTLEKKDYRQALSLVNQQRPVPQHYHIIYHVPSENIALPHFKQAFPTQRAAMQHMFRVGVQSEPQTEWYDDGRVGVETTLHGRTGEWWIVLEVAGCVASECRPRTGEFLRSVPVSSEEPQILDLPASAITPVQRVVDPNGDVS